MRSAVEFFESYWVPLTLGTVAICLMIADAPIGALICAFGAGHFYRENP